MEILITLLVKVVFGVACAAIANGRGRSSAAWFFIGFLFDCLALIVLLVIPDLKIEEEKRRELERENLRLRERMRKERMVSDRRYQETVGRLDVHDRALGVDTSNLIQEPANYQALPSTTAPAIAPGVQEPPTQPLEETEQEAWQSVTPKRGPRPDPQTGAQPRASQAAPPKEAPGKRADLFDKLVWYYLQDLKPVGPVHFKFLKRLWQEGRIRPETMLWNEKMKDWASLRELPEVREAFRG